MLLFNHKGVRTSLASTYAHITEIGRLRYNSYLDADAVKDCTTFSMLDEYDHRENTVNHYASINGEMVGAIRMCYFHPDHNHLSIPCKEVFYQEIEREIGLDNALVESCRFVVKPGISKRLLTNFLLVKTSIVAAWASHCPFIVTACRTTHEPFYTRMGMQRISDPKQYPGLEVDMVLLMAPIDQNKEKQINDTYGLLQFGEMDKEAYRSNLLYLAGNQWSHLQNHYHGIQRATA